MINLIIPIIYLMFDSCSTVFQPGNMTVYDGDACVLTTRVEIRYRGASALQFQKKSFGIKLLNEDGTDRDFSFFDMRSDNSWILDAMACDKSRMRNRVCMDLWRDFSVSPYYSTTEPKQKNYTDGRFVEVYVNGDYQGIYCLSEKIDRKQLKLKKFTTNEMRGALYKTVKYANLHSLDEAFYHFSNDSVSWQGIEFQYPDMSEQGPCDWTPLVNLIRYLNFSDSVEINRSFTNRIDVPLWVDYFLFVDLIMGDDNISKNQYLYFYDTSMPSKLCIAPWDLDATIGRDWLGNENDANREMNLSNWVNYHLSYVYTPTFTAYKDRYFELRDNLFHPDSLKSRFSHYFIHLHDVLLKEQERWSGVDGIDLDFDNEHEYIKTWIDKRIEFLDHQYSHPLSIEAFKKFEKFERFEKFNLAGQRVSDDYKGIYIIKGKKYINNGSIRH